MGYVAKHEKKQYPQPSEGGHSAICVDFIGPWRALSSFPGEDEYPIQKIAYVFQLDQAKADGTPFEVASKDLTISFGKKANLRSLVGSWRGKTVSDAEAKTGVEIDYKGQPAYLTIEHVEKRDGGLRSAITSVIPLPPGMTPIAASAYTRADFWAKRIAEDEKKAEEFEQRSLHAKVTGAANASKAKSPDPVGGFDDFPDALGEEEAPF